MMASAYAEVMKIYKVISILILLAMLPACAYSSSVNEAAGAPNALVNGAAAFGFSGAAAVTESPTQAIARPAATLAATPTPPEAVPAEVPQHYRSLYAALQDSIDSYNRQISSQWNGSLYPVNFAAELIAADTNGGNLILQPNVKNVMLEEISADKALGVQAITVQIGFPIFDPYYFEYLGQSSTQAGQTVQTWIDYYSSVAQAIHSRGLKMNVEANPLLTFDTGSNSSLDASGYYRSLDWATYQQRRSAQNVVIARQIRPDYLLLQTEPQTDAVNDFHPQLNDPLQDTAMIARFVGDLENAGLPGLHTTLKIGSGVGSWQRNWRAYINRLVAIKGLDELDTHVYNLQPSLDEIGVAMQVADLAHAAGKGASISEFWLHKSTDLAGFSNNGDPLLDVRARDTFTFWSPLDVQFLTLMARLANDKHFDSISAFGHFYWFSLLDYSSLPASCPPA